MSKEDEWVLIDEKVYLLQGAKPKATAQQGLLPAIGPNSNGERRRAFASSGHRHFQQNESRSEVKTLPRRPQKLISVGDVSLITARQGNKIPYCRTSSAPLPGLTSPSRLSSSPRMPQSAPPQFFSEPGVQQDTERDISSLIQENGSGMKKATIRSQREHLFYERKSNIKAQVGSQRKQKYFAPQKIRRERFSITENDEPEALNEMSASSLEHEDFEEVFEFPPVPGSQTQQEVSGLPQKAMSDDTAGEAKDMIGLCDTARELNALNGIGPRSFSPDSFVAQLIANTEKLILNDSIESPTLQKPKKPARKGLH